MPKLPSKKTTKAETEEPKKIKTTGRVVKPKTVAKTVTKASSPKKKGEKAPVAIKETVSKPKAEQKPNAKRASTGKKVINSPIKVSEDNVSSPVTNSVPIMERVGPTKTKRFKEDRYVKVSADASQEDFTLIGKRVQNGELQWAFYAVTNEDQACHYYLDLTKK